MPVNGSRWVIAPEDSITIAIAIAIGTDCYRYKTSRNMAASGLPSPPFVDVPGTANFRDAGDGKTFRKGLIYRSADPSKATEEGLEQMSKDLGMTGLRPSIPDKMG